MNTPDRGSSKSGPRLDDERKKEVEGQIRSGRSTRAEDWHDPEPPVDPPPYTEERETSRLQDPREDR
ncbi:hypothetical protein ACFYV5_10735 [Streptomyces sp. NPDC003035]|uniref:hypothetical protein n=1 Tax=Streptomyces sp. NPDC003035 TaxID=3364676 RepID=UPI0036AFFF71